MKEDRRGNESEQKREKGVMIMSEKAAAGRAKSGHRKKNREGWQWASENFKTVKWVRKWRVKIGYRREEEVEKLGGVPTRD